jgi:hypothetical protein
MKLPFRPSAGMGANDSIFVYAVEWTTNQIKWYLDDTLYLSATRLSASLRRRLQGPGIFQTRSRKAQLFVKIQCFRTQK